MLLIVAAAGLGMVLKDRSRSLPARAPGERPELAVLTSLPIVFPEEFTLQAPASPALKALQSRYRIVPIGVTDAESLDGRRLLLMAQPQAQPAEALVELDQWVRGGGRVLLLADPALEWRSERPLGDLLRPPLAFADTGLLGHWGLRLDAPDSRGPKSIAIGGSEIRTNSPGELVATAKDCAVEPERLIARCRIGTGQAIVVADADFIDTGRLGGRAGSANLDLLLAELARLEHRFAESPPLTDLSTGELARTGGEQSRKLRQKSRGIPTVGMKSRNMASKSIVSRTLLSYQHRL